MALLVFFASLSSRRRFKSSSDNVANLDFDPTMTKLFKLLVSVLVTSLLQHKTIVCRYDVTSTYIVCRYDVKETASKNRPLSAKPSRDLLFIKLWAATKKHVDWAEARKMAVTPKMCS